MDVKKFKSYELIPSGPDQWIIPARGDMRVPGKIFANEAMINSLVEEKGGLEQVINVAHLPGIVGYSIGLPDIHWGYGFPIGGVAATSVEEGVISPGGVGYDINCGVRLLTTSLNVHDVKNQIPSLVKKLFQSIPTGVGSHGALKKLTRNDFFELLSDGAAWAVRKGFGEADDLKQMEENGRLNADPSLLSERAIERGIDQVGTLGSGNHFLEIQKVDRIIDPETAKIFNLAKDQIVVMIHTGSRGLGHQVCDDYLHKYRHLRSLYQFNLPDPQLVCVPVSSPEGQEYLSAMAAAANFAWANRQVIMALTEKVMQEYFTAKKGNLNFKLLYDVSHNIAKIEEHTIDGKLKMVCVHRKGATRAFPAGRPEIPSPFRQTGQPVIIPGDMGRCSYVLSGQPQAMKETFGSSCHGAGRILSRRKAIKKGRDRNLFKEMNLMGVEVMARGKRTVAEEMPYAYKDVNEVVKVVSKSGLSNIIARLKPIGVIKG